MKFLVVLSVLLALFIQMSLQAPSRHHNNHAMRFPDKNFEIPDATISNESDDDEKEGDDFVFVKKTDLKNLVASENAAFDTLETVLDNLPKRRNKRNDIADFLDKTWDGIEKSFKDSLPDIVANAIKGDAQN
uniref:Uncharacterized protein n=1 Tax=Panagrolaimus superbus TaxID=310955 RepID=A0A914YBB7_9BILA